MHDRRLEWVTARWIRHNGFLLTIPRRISHIKPPVESMPEVATHLPCRTSKHEQISRC